MTAQQDSTSPFQTPEEYRKHLSELKIQERIREVEAAWRKLLLKKKEAARVEMQLLEEENAKLLGLLAEMVEEFWDGDDCKRSGTSNKAAVHPGSLVAIEAVRYVRSLDPARVALSRMHWDYIEGEEETDQPSPELYSNRG